MVIPARIAALRAWIAGIRDLINEFVSADAALADQALLDRLNGVNVETPPYWDANDRATAALEALPLWTRPWAHRASWRANHDKWGTVLAPTRKDQTR